MREKRETIRYGVAGLARDILAIHDNLERALNAIGEEERKQHGAFIEGLELTKKEFVTVLGKHGIKPIVPARGDDFNPKHHEAMFEAPVKGARKGTIIEVMSKGFRIHERLLRPATVGVASKPVVHENGDRAEAGED